jgi:Na+-transporting NADH:ubiquinone oxidoreductase subunit F
MLIISGIAAALALVLVLADRFVSNYGECDITINGDTTITVDGGSSLLESLTANKIFIPSACGGGGTCAYCKVKVLEGGGQLLPIEEPYLDEEERKQEVRLSCQVKVRNPLRIEIPEELFNVKEYVCECTRIRDLTHDIKEFRFRLQDPAAMAYTPGQYVQLLAPPYNDNEEVYRAYSISSDPLAAGLIELVIRLVPGGICTTWCFEHLKETDAVKLNGPYGDFHLSDTGAPLLFVAGGSGMAPVKCILHQMQSEGNRREAVYFFGANRVDELFYLEEMAELEESLPNFGFVPVVANPEEGAKWSGESGLVTEALERCVTDASKHEAYLCGSPGMIDAASKVLLKLGMDESKIYYDKFE